LHVVIQAGMIHNLKHRMNCACFRIIRAKNQPFQACMNHRAGAHRARLNCNKQLAVPQAMVTDVFSSLTKSDDLGVGRGIRVGQIAIPPFTHDLSVADYNRTDRHFANVQSAMGGEKRLLHPEFVGKRIGCTVIGLPFHGV